MRSKSRSKAIAVAKFMSGESLEEFATSLRADFRFAPLNVLLLVAIFVAGLVLHLRVYPFSPTAVLLFVGSALALAVILRLTQVWEAVVIFGTADGLMAYLYLRPDRGAGQRAGETHTGSGSDVVRCVHVERLDGASCRDRESAH